MDTRDSELGLRERCMFVSNGKTGGSEETCVLIEELPG